MVVKKKAHESREGVSQEQRLSALFSYLLGWVTGIIFYFVKGDDAYVRYHAAQSIVLFGGLNILFILTSIFIMPLLIIPFIGFVLYTLVFLILSLGGFILWLYSMVRAYQGARFRLPIVTSIVETYFLGGKER